jgi:hypothetical protein
MLAQGERLMDNNRKNKGRARAVGGDAARICSICFFALHMYCHELGILIRPYLL